MTYCVALKVDEGLVFASDTRTNAGVDYVTSYSKLHTFRPAEDRVFVLLSAGSLATTRELIDQVGRDLDDAPNPKNGASLLSARYVFEAAEYLGGLNRMIQEKHGPALARTGVSGETSLILGGQIAGRPPELLLIYPQGNYIGASAETPYLQIGETKYGKPILDRLAHPGLSVSQAATLALVSLDATVRSNVTVAAPFDFALFRGDQFSMPERIRLSADSAYYVQTRTAWQQGMEAMFSGLSPFPRSPAPDSVFTDPSPSAMPADTLPGVQSGPAGSNPTINET